MVTMELEQAREDLPALAEKALSGEDVFIAVGGRRLRLAWVADAAEAAMRHRGRAGGEARCADSWS